MHFTDRTVATDCNPVELFKQKRSDADTAVVLGHIEGGQLVLDNRNQGGDQHELGNITMYQEAPEHGGQLILE